MKNSRVGRKPTNKQKTRTRDFHFHWNNSLPDKFFKEKKENTKFHKKTIESDPLTE